jgi:hypothetical protein
MMKAFRLAGVSAAVLGMVAGTISPAFAQNRVRQRPVVYETAPPLVVRPGYRAAPVVTGVVVGTAAGVLAANSSQVASALGASTTIGAGFGFGAIGGVGALILYCAIAKPRQECF